MGHLKDAWHSLPEWAKPVILAALLSLLTAIFIGVRLVVLWLVGYHREKFSQRIVDCLHDATSFNVFDGPAVGKKASEIAESLHVPVSKVEAYLKRLEKEWRVHRTLDHWHPGPPPNQAPIPISRWRPGWW